MLWKYIHMVHIYMRACVHACKSTHTCMHTPGLDNNASLVEENWFKANCYATALADSYILYMGQKEICTIFMQHFFTLTFIG